MTVKLPHIRPYFSYSDLCNCNITKSALIVATKKYACNNIRHLLSVK